MTSPSVRPRARPESAYESISEWSQLYNRQITYGVIALAVVVGGVWFYGRSQALKTERAERAYFGAQQSLPGNLPLAESDLRKLITRYDGTTAAKLAQLTLARLLFEENKFSEGIDVLQKALPALSNSKDFASDAHLLMAAGYEQMPKFAAAANEYAAAAKSARFDQDRQRWESAGASAYLRAGDVETAKRIWTGLAADSKGTVAGEARVRLGELLAKAESKS